jgi:hypothetical protein
MVCLSYTHDRDYLKYREKPPMHAKMSRRGWCPPLFAAHDAEELSPPRGAAGAAGRGGGRDARRRALLQRDNLRESDDSASEEVEEVVEDEREREGMQVEQATRLQEADELRRALAAMVEAEEEDAQVDYAQVD